MPTTSTTQSVQSRFLSVISYGRLPEGLCWEWRSVKSEEEVHHSAVRQWDLFQYIMTSLWLNLHILTVSANTPGITWKQSCCFHDIVPVYFTSSTCGNARSEIKAEAAVQLSHVRLPDVAERGNKVCWQCNQQQQWKLLNSRTSAAWTHSLFAPRL